ncbi:MAG: AraC family transcriptional regulator [Myxococcota bacterium]
MDLLTALLSFDPIRCSSAARRFMRPPWRWQVEPPHPLQIILLSRGPASFLTIEGGEPIAVNAGEILLIGEPVGFSLRSDLDVESSRPGAASWDDGGELSLDTNLMIEGVLTPSMEGRWWVPSVLRLPGAQVRGRLRTLTEGLMDEALHPGAGSQVLAERVFDGILVALLRTWAAEAGAEAGWLGGLNDSALSAVMALVLTHPGQDWSVTALAERSGLSRASFAQRFRAVTGQTPMAFVAQIRLDLAARRLRETERTLAEIAAETGYATPFALSRAFKRMFGRSPDQWRKEAG